MFLKHNNEELNLSIPLHEISVLSYYILGGTGYLSTYTSQLQTADQRHMKLKE